jgi:carboxylesterase
MLWILFAVAAAIGGTDFTYDRVVHFRHDRWEKNVVKRNADGLRIGYEEFSCGTGRVALLMIHGFGAGPVTYGRMAPEFAKRGFACEAMILPGFGRPMSEYKKATRTQWNAAIHDEVLKLRENHDQVWVVGHSMGGTLALVEALDHPHDVDGLVLLAPLIEVNPKRSPVFSPRAWFEITDKIVFFTDMTEMAFPVDVHDPEVKASVIRDEFVPRRIYRELFSLTDTVRNRGKELRVPVFLAYAKDDLAADPQAARKYAGSATNAPRNEISCQTNSGHVVTWDYGWEQTVEAVSTFINHP